MTPPVSTTPDFTRPNLARVYDCLLGGHENFLADRAEAESLLGIYPLLRDMAAENRAFIARAVTWAAAQGIRQFADLGAGFPVHPAVHEIAREADPASRSAYIDTDPVVVSHTRAMAWKEDGGRESRSSKRI